MMDYGMASDFSDNLIAKPAAASQPGRARVQGKEQRTFIDAFYRQLCLNQLTIKYTQ